jgi:putative MFS transporter
MSKMEAEVMKCIGRPLPPAPLLSAIAAPAHSQGSIATLFSAEYRWRTVMAFGLWFFALIGFFG